jgi:hypothetical protein
MSIGRRITKREAAADVVDPEPVTIVVYRVDIAALRANPDAKPPRREVRRIVVTRRAR